MDIFIDCKNIPNSLNPKQIVFYKKQSKSALNNVLFAWKVVNISSKKERYHLQINDEYHLSMERNGNFSMPVRVEAGKHYEIRKSELKSRDEILFEDYSQNQNEIQLANALSKGAFNIEYIYSGSLAFRWHNLIPWQLACFEFDPFIYASFIEDHFISESNILDKNLIDTQLTVQFETGTRSLSLEFDEKKQYRLTMDKQCKN
jgi:hypothetical protein